MRLYNADAPSLLTDEQLDYTIKEIDEDLAACEKLKPGPWHARYTGLSLDWHGEPAHNTVEVLAYADGTTRTEYAIASGTILETQREVMFMAAMREAYPAVLRQHRAALVAIRELRRQLARKKGRRR